MKKYILSILTLAVLTSQSAFAYFNDLPANHWANKQITALTEKNIVVGYPDGSFHPDENVTRAEFASMAIKALGQEETNVFQPIKFIDIDSSYWAYEAIQKAVYFDLISNNKDSEHFRPEDSVSRAEAINIAVNSLTTEQISAQKAHDVLARKYKDINDIPEWFIIPAGKAEILDMLSVKSDRKGYVDADRPATRAEVTAILYDMMIQAKLNPNAKLAEFMRKKTGEGYVVKGSYVQGSVGTIPKNAIVPIKVDNGFSSQTSKRGEEFTANAEEHYITQDKFILVYKGTQFRGSLKDVKQGKLFIRNGVLQLGSDTITTPNDQHFAIEIVGNVSMKKNKFMTWFRRIFKGEKVILNQGDTVYVKFMKEMKTDLTNGWIYYE